MAARNETTEHGELTNSPYRRNKLETANGVVLTAKVLVMPCPAEAPAPAIIGQVQSVGRDGRVSVRWYRPEQNTPAPEDGTVAVGSFTEKIAPAYLLAITPQRARLTAG